MIIFLPHIILLMFLFFCFMLPKLAGWVSVNELKYKLFSLEVGYKSAKPKLTRVCSAGSSKTYCRQFGHVLLTCSQVLMHIVWKKCRQRGSSLARCRSRKSARHTEHRRPSRTCSLVMLNRGKLSIWPSVSPCLVNIDRVIKVGSRTTIRMKSANTCVSAASSLSYTRCSNAADSSAEIGRPVMVKWSVRSASVNDSRLLRRPSSDLGAAAAPSVGLSSRISTRTRIALGLTLVLGCLGASTGVSGIQGLPTRVRKGSAVKIKLL